MKKSRKKKIIEENKETLVGTFKRSQNFGFVIPDDKNVEGDIYIPKRKMAKARKHEIGGMLDFLQPLIDNFKSGGKLK